MEGALPIVTGIVIAILGALGGIAAILRVQSDNSSSVASGAKAVSEGAKTVIELMNDRLDDNEAQADAHTKRLDGLEEYVSHFDEWADKLLTILERAIVLLPDALRAEFLSEAEGLKTTRPKRESARRTTTRTTTTKEVQQTTSGPATS